MAPQRLGDDEIDQALADLADWERDGDAIVASFRFSGFTVAFAFMTEMAFVAEKLNHHPEWFNVYNRVEVKLTTHDSDGITALDLELAGAMSSAAARHG